VEVVASLSQGRTAAAQCGLFTHKSVPVLFEPPCISLGVIVYRQCSKLYSSNPRQLICLQRTIPDAASLQLT
jgi:hypothetical protein